MSKNFELLHNISNEKELFQALDGWEDADETSVDPEPETETQRNGRVGVRVQHQSRLPDVFQAIDDTLGPLDLETTDLSSDPEPAQKPNDTLEKEMPRLEAQGTNFEARFPISRNPVTRLASDLDFPQAWVRPGIGLRPNDEVDLESEPGTLPGKAIPESAPTPERVAGSSDAKVQAPSLARETHREPPHPQPFRNFGADDGKANDESRAKKGRTRSAYRNPRREAIAREEEFKLVQRIFLAEEDAPGMVVFSGFGRDTGCASICIRTAEILAAQTEGSVCLVDMGLRVPSLHEYCGVPNDRGLAEAVSDSNPIQEFARQLSPANLWVIPSGHSAPQLNFAKVADRLRGRVEELRKAFRFVVVHSGSLWLNADAMLISKWTDGVVLILEAHSTRRDTARRIKESLAAANARVLGVVLNNRTYPIPETLYCRL